MDTEKLNIRRINQVAEHIRQTMLEELENYHSWLISDAGSSKEGHQLGQFHSSDTRIIPPFSEFLSLPVISALLPKSLQLNAKNMGKRDIARIKHDLYDRTGTIKRLVDQEIDSWVIKTKDRLAIILNKNNKAVVKSLRNGTVGPVHPIDYPTALFACECILAEPAVVVTKNDGCFALEASAPTFEPKGVGMDFRAVCLHRCQRGSAPWSVDRFFPDLQAARIMGLALETTGVVLSDVSMKLQLEERRKTLVFKCESCDTSQPIYLSMLDVVSKRLWSAYTFRLRPPNAPLGTA